MEKENKKIYSQRLLEAYRDEDLKLLWSTSGFSIAFNPQAKKEIKNLKNKEFVKYVFDICKVVSDIVQDNTLNEQIEAEDLEVANEIISEEFDLKNHLYIKKHATIECFKVFEYEIVSHMDIDNPTDIAASAAIIKIDTDLQDKDEKLIFEITRRDLKAFIAKLSELDLKLDLLK